MGRAPAGLGVGVVYYLFNRLSGQNPPWDPNGDLTHSSWAPGHTCCSEPINSIDFDVIDTSQLHRM